MLFSEKISTKINVSQVHIMYLRFIIFIAINCFFMKRLLLAAACLIFFSQFVFSQLLIWTPDFSKDNDNITITVDATKGNVGLLNYNPTSDVYVHIGLITSASTSSDDWRYSKFTWGH